MAELGITFEDERWPYGLRCAACHREFHRGDRYSESLVGFVNEAPVVRIVCVGCALLGAPTSAAPPGSRLR